MSNTEKWHIDVDLSNMGDSYRRRLLYTAMINKNGRGTASMTASRFCLICFNEYDPDLPIEVARRIAVRNESKHIMELYGFEDVDDIYRYIRTHEAREFEELVCPGRKCIVINACEDGAYEFKNTLQKLTYKQRSQLIYCSIEQYLLLGKDEWYMDLSANTVIQSLINTYKKIKTNKEKEDEIRAYIETTIKEIVFQSKL